MPHDAPLGPERRAPNPRAVEAMFDDIVGPYDLLNRIMSLGLDRRWRRTAAWALRLHPGERVLDLGCGTGDLSIELAAQQRADVVGVDLSRGMLRRAAHKSSTEDAATRARLRFVRGSAFALPFVDATFDAAASAFVLRNLHDLDAAFSEIARVVRPGGRVAFMDITEPRAGPMRAAFDAWFSVVPPALGWLAGKGGAYRYLVRSVAQLPAAEKVGDMLRGAGFSHPRARALAGGAVTLFTAGRP